MQRLHSVDPTTAQGRTRELFHTVEAKFGSIPNVARVMANSPAVLDSFLALSTAMGQAGIGGQLLHQVKLAASESNHCEYCNSILTHLGSKGGISTADLLAGRRGASSEPRADAALRFAKVVLETRGQVGDDDLQAVRQAGFTDSEIVEIVAGVVVGCFTNFLNNVADTTLDVPRAEPLEACATTAGSCGCS